MKCSAAKVNGVWRDVWKDPIGGGKTSKKGLVYCDGVMPYDSVGYSGLTNPKASLHFPEWVVYYNGDEAIRPRDSWETVKKRASI